MNKVIISPADKTIHKLSLNGSGIASTILTAPALRSMLQTGCGAKMNSIARQTRKKAALPSQVFLPIWRCLPIRLPINAATESAMVSINTAATAACFSNRTNASVVAINNQVAPVRFLFFSSSRNRGKNIFLNHFLPKEL